MDDTKSTTPGSAKVVEKRWTDHWQVRVMTYALGLCVMLLVGGGTWLVRSVVASEQQDARQDEQIKSTADSLKDFRDEQRAANRRIEDKLDALKR